MLRVKQHEPWYVLPQQRYSLTTRPPSTSMNGNFTFFCKFKVEDAIDTEKPCSVMMRPGMHTGLCYVQGEEHINWEFWYEKDGVNEFGHIAINLDYHLPNTKLSDEWIAIVRHFEHDKEFSLKLINSRTAQTFQKKTNYNGVLNNYEHTPYNFGCGNYFKQVDDSHYFFGDYSLEYAGLLESTRNSDNEILNFVEKNKEAFTTLQEKGKLEEIIFYFNMMNKNRYKVWDLSEHCNFLQYNVDVFK